MSPQRLGTIFDQGTARPIRFGLVGCGQWGANVAAATQRCATMRIAAVADRDVHAAEHVATRLATRPKVVAPTALFDDEEIDAVLVVTDVATHFDLAMGAMRQGKHVFVEKPLAMSTAECAALVNAATSTGLTLMVGHTFLYSEHVADIERAVQRGQLGDLRYVHLQRLAYGRFRDDANVIWNLGPHDVSILMSWARRPPIAVRCVEYMFTRPTLSDVAFLTLDFGDFLGHVQLSCIDPGKVRRATLAGTTGGIVYDDVGGSVRLTINGSAADPVLLSPANAPAPLDAEIAHFAQCIRDNTTPRTDGIHGAKVVAVLEAASQSAADGGTWIDITGSLNQMTSMIHPIPPPDFGAGQQLVATSPRMALT